MPANEFTDKKVDMDVTCTEHILVCVSLNEGLKIQNTKLGTTTV